MIQSDFNEGFNNWFPIVFHGNRLWRNEAGFYPKNL
jgi:hypothetical protein